MFGRIDTPKNWSGRRSTSKKCLGVFSSVLMLPGDEGLRL